MKGEREGEREGQAEVGETEGGWRKGGGMEKEKKKRGKKLKTF